MSANMEGDDPLKAEELPEGFTPLWLDFPPTCQNPTHKEILTRLSKLPEIGNKSVTVLYDDSSIPEQMIKEAEEYCKDIQWSYTGVPQMIGCENDVIIVIDALTPETISRARNLLVMVTTHESSALEHE